MILIETLAVATALSTSSAIDSSFSCLKGFEVTAAAHRLEDLPKDVKEGLQYLETHFLKEKIAEAGSPLLQSDAPSAAERELPGVRFAQAVLVNDRWFVQFEVAMFSGVRTISFTRGGHGKFQLSPSHYFNGPACESIKAALSGVTTPGGL